MFFTTTVLLFISMASPALSSANDCAYSCSIITDTNGVVFPDQATATFVRPYRWMTLWKNESVGSLTQPGAHAVLVPGKTTSKMLSKLLHSTEDWPEFLLYGNETFKFKYPYCDPEFREFNKKKGNIQCQAGKWKERTLQRAVQRI